MKSKRGEDISETVRASSSPVGDVLERQNTSEDSGLSEEEAKSRLRKYGHNKLREIQKESLWEILANQFKSLIVLLLAVAGLLSFTFGQFTEGVAIIVVIVINGAIGFFTEMRARRSMEALRQLGQVKSKVRRGGEVEEIPAEELVPGDIVLLEGGDIITADLRLIEVSKLQCDESSLTGESLPVSKSEEVLEKDLPLAERENMAFKGTSVTRGSGEGVVISTGMETELGEISALVEEAEGERTPLEKKLAQLGHRLIWATLIITAGVAASGIIAGREVLLMIETAIALAVAAIPEGLPIVATIALARGMWRMAERNALINKLSAVETLGGTNVIMTDKTGTLTENRMTVTRYLLDSEEIAVEGEGGGKQFKADNRTLEPDEYPQLREALEVGVLCSNASLGEDRGAEGVGDPLEISLLEAAKEGGVNPEKVREAFPEVKEVAFDPDTKMMATYHRENSGYFLAAKGAPEEIIENSSRFRSSSGSEKGFTEDEKKELLDRNDRLAERGLRVLGLARKKVDSVDEKPYEDLEFLGLVGMMDPPRDEVGSSVESCEQAGVRVIMVTGDQADTAKNIAVSLGIASEGDQVINSQDIEEVEGLNDSKREELLLSPVFARVSPKQKLELINLHQRDGSIVAMTGDGVNDAPALKKADIGIAMGKRGTQVAQQAADMILKDDRFSSIVSAIEGGRTIFNNIRKFVRYLLSCNISEITTVALASFIGLPLPILPLQILFLNLVTDVFPALALGLGEGEPDIMRKPPRDPDSPILKRAHWMGIVGYSLLIMGAVLGSLQVGLSVFEFDTTRAVTVSFLTLAFSQLWHVFNMKGKKAPVISNEITGNRYVWYSLILCSALLLAAIYVPVFSSTLSIVNPGVSGWGLILVMSILPLICGQLVGFFRKVFAE